MLTFARHILKSAKNSNIICVTSETSALKISANAKSFHEILILVVCTNNVREFQYNIKSSLKVKGHSILRKTYDAIKITKWLLGRHVVTRYKNCDFTRLGIVKKMVLFDIFIMFTNNRYLDIQLTILSRLSMYWLFILGPSWGLFLFDH